MKNNTIKLKHKQLIPESTDDIIFKLLNGIIWFLVGWFWIIVIALIIEHAPVIAQFP